MEIDFTGMKIMSVAQWLGKGRPHKDIVVTRGPRSEPHRHPVITGVVKKNGIELFPAKEAGKYVPAVFDEDLHQ